MRGALLARMARHLAFALGHVGVAALLTAVAGCSTSNSQAGNPDAAETHTSNDAGVPSDAGGDGFVPLECNAGCLCFGADACPSGCFPSITKQPDGSGSEPFCSNGIVQCVTGGFSWSLGTPANNCPGLNPPGSQIALPDYPVTYLDGGPDGAFCCERENAAVDAAAGTGASDAGTDGGPSDASRE